MQVATVHCTATSCRSSLIYQYATFRRSYLELVKVCLVLWSPSVTAALRLLQPEGRIEVTSARNMCAFWRFEPGSTECTCSKLQTFIHGKAHSLRQVLSNVSSVASGTTKSVASGESLQCACQSLWASLHINCGATLATLNFRSYMHYIVCHQCHSACCFARGHCFWTCALSFWLLENARRSVGDLCKVLQVQKDLILHAANLA